MADTAADRRPAAPPAASASQRSSSSPVGHDHGGAGQQAGRGARGSRSAARRAPRTVQVRSAPVRPLPGRDRRRDRGGHRARCRRTASRPSRARAPASRPGASPASRTTSTLTPSGNSPASSTGGAVRSKSATGSSITQARCGLPTEIASPARPVPPSRADPRPVTCAGAHVHGELGRPAPRATSRTPARVPIGELRPGGQAVVEQVPGEHPDPVAAHLGDAAVGVAVVHEPLGAPPVGQAGPVPGLGPGRRRPDHPQHPVAADPGPPVADPRDGSARTAPAARRDRAGSRSRCRSRAPWRSASTDRRGHGG